MVNATSGFWSMWRVLSAVLLDQKYSDGPSLTYRNVAACGLPVGDAVANVSVFCALRYSRTGPGSSCSVVLMVPISLVRCLSADPKGLAGSYASARGPVGASVAGP